MFYYAALHINRAAHVADIFPERVGRSQQVFLPNVVLYVSKAFRRSSGQGVLDELGPP